MRERGTHERGGEIVRERERDRDRESESEKVREGGRQGPREAGPGCRPEGTRWGRQRHVQRVDEAGEDEEEVVWVEGVVVVVGCRRRW